MDLHKFPFEIVYEDMVLPGKMVTPQYIEQVKELKVKDSEVLVATYPRSGTTWMCEIIYLLQNDGDVQAARSIPFYERTFFLEHAHESTSATDIQEGEDLSGMMRSKSQRTNLVLKSHLPIKFLEKQVFEQQAKTVVVMRNPKDNLVSLYHFYQSNGHLGFFQGSWNDFFRMVEADHMLYGNWADHVIGYYRQRHRPNVLIIFYEDMIYNMDGCLTKISHFLGKELSKELRSKVLEYSRFESMKNNEMVNGQTLIDAGVFKGSTPFTRSGKVGGWKDLFTPSQNQFVEKHFIEKCTEVGLNFKYE